MGTDIDLFASAGDGLLPGHFGLDNGRAFVEAPAFGRAMGYASTQKALQQVDEDEKGQLLRLTPGGQQMVNVIYEDGIWELIFRSTLPSARVIKARVKAILRELRETGVVDTREKPMTELDMARGYVAALERIAELEPAAESWAQLADASGDYSMREVAQILNRDPSISTGQNRLSRYLKSIRWVDEDGTPYQRQVDLGRLLLRMYTDRQDVLRRQIRLTPKGVHELHRLLGGSGPVLLEVAS